MLDRLIRTLMGGCTGIAFWACGGAATNLHPESIGKDEAPIIGRIQVVEHGEQITAHCYADFTDAAGQRKAYVSLDDSGWVLIAVPRGKTYLPLTTT